MLKYVVKLWESVSNQLMGGGCENALVELIPVQFEVLLHTTHVGG